MGLQQCGCGGLLALPPISRVAMQPRHESQVVPFLIACGDTFPGLAPIGSCAQQSDDVPLRIYAGIAYTHTRTVPAMQFIEEEQALYTIIRQRWVLGLRA